MRSDIHNSSLYIFPIARCGRLRMEQFSPSTSSQQFTSLFHLVNINSRRWLPLVWRRAKRAGSRSKIAHIIQAHIERGELLAKDAPTSVMQKYIVLEFGRAKGLSACRDWRRVGIAIWQAAVIESNLRHRFQCYTGWRWLCVIIPNWHPMGQSN